jgi:hypothetical protein
MHQPGVASGPAVSEQPLFLIALQPSASWATLGRSPHQGAGVEWDMDIPFPTRRIDGVGEDVELAIHGGPGDDLEPLIAVGGEVGTRDRRHADPGKGAQRHGLQAQVLGPRAALGRRYIAPIALQDLGQGGALGGASVDDNAAIELCLDAAGPLLGHGLVIESPGLSGGALAPDFDPPELAALLDCRHRTVSVLASHTHAPQVLSQYCPKMTKIRTCSNKHDLRKLPKPLF